MNTPFSATSTTTKTKVGSNDYIWLCDDRPDWSVYSWENVDKVVYGPVSSRRLGQSLGINLFPTGKTCNFTCVYCDLDVQPSILQMGESGSRESLLDCIAEEMLIYIDTPPIHLPHSITFAGNGEPTLSPSFPYAVELVKKLRDRHIPGVPLSLFTNGIHLNKQGTRQFFASFERIFLKVDGATRDFVERLNGCGSWTTTTRAVKFSAGLHNVAASTILVNGTIDSIAEVLSSEYVRLLCELCPVEVFLYTLDYPTVSSGLRPVSMDVLIECTKKLAEKVACPIIGLWRRYRHPMVEERSVDA